MINKIKKIFNWKVSLGLFLIFLSAFFYLLHYSIFHDSHHIFIYLLGDIAFVPVEVLMVTLIIHKLLESREKREKLNKLNMVIGAFFSEVGTDLISFFAGVDIGAKDINQNLIMNNNWTEKDFKKTSVCLNVHAYNIKLTKDDAAELREFLIAKRNFLLRLLENPNILEHDTFTELLWAVFHLTDELQHRKKIKQCSEIDLEHLTGDIKRAYCLLLKEWLFYIKHLKEDYPYLFSLAVRTNPFDPEAAAEVK